MQHPRFPQAILTTRSRFPLKFLEDQLRTLNNVLSLADIDNMLQGPMQIYSKVTGIYRRVKGILDKTRGLTYTVANLDEELKRRFNS